MRIGLGLAWWWTGWLVDWLVGLCLVASVELSCPWCGWLNDQLGEWLLLREACMVFWCTVAALPDQRTRHTLPLPLPLPLPPAASISETFSLLCFAFYHQVGAWCQSLLSAFRA